MTYTEAIKLLESSGESFEFPVSWGLDLQSEHERYITEKRVGRPVVVTDYPRDIKAFYMRLNDDGETVRAMDVLVPRIGEIIGGSQREEREDVLLERMKQSGLDAENYWWYLDLRRYGTVPHAGFGLGFERTVQPRPFPCDHCHRHAKMCYCAFNIRTTDCAVPIPFPEEIRPEIQPRSNRCGVAEH